MMVTNTVGLMWPMQDLESQEFLSLICPIGPMILLDQLKGESHFRQQNKTNKVATATATPS